jgi:hypothetical protein
MELHALATSVLGRAASRRNKTINNAPSVRLAHDMATAALPESRQERRLVCGLRLSGKTQQVPTSQQSSHR